MSVRDTLTRFLTWVAPLLIAFVLTFIGGVVTVFWCYELVKPV
jgi:hypothetical protein